MYGRLAGPSMVLGAPIGVTPGSVLFGGAGGVLAQDNANFFYNDATNSLTIGGQIIGPDGVGATPSFTFSSDTTSGLFLVAPGTIDVTILGLSTHRLNSDYANFIGSVRVANNNAGSALSIGAANDVQLFRDAAAILAQRNGANAQTLRVYGTTVGNVYLSLAHDGTDAVISASSGQLTFGNKIFPSTDAAAKQTVAGIYAGNGVPNNANGANGDFYFRGDGAAGTFVYHRAGGAWAAFA